MLSQTAEYGLRAVLYIAMNADGEPVKLARIAEALHVPKNYLSKTLYQLARSGVLLSERGPVGGFALARPPESLTLAEVVEPFDSARLARRCLLGEGPCSDETACAAHARWKTIAEPMRGFFRSTVVADLISGAAEYAPDVESGAGPSPAR